MPIAAGERHWPGREGSRASKPIDSSCPAGAFEAEHEAMVGPATPGAVQGSAPPAEIGEAVPTAAAANDD